MHALCYLLKELFARRVFNETHERLHIRAELHAGAGPGLRRRYRRQAFEKRKLAQSGDGAGLERVSQKIAAIWSGKHTPSPEHATAVRARRKRPGGSLTTEEMLACGFLRLHQACGSPGA